MGTPIYLDNNATTPLDPRVVDAMLPVLRDHFGNPASTTHRHGWYAEELVQVAREHVARLIGAQTNEIIFTSGATEANNLALKGFAHACAHRRSSEKHHLISVVTEHRSVLDPLRRLERDGFELDLLGVNQEGLLDLDHFTGTFRANTILASVMLANNEIGVIQNIPLLAARAKQRSIRFHSDATQAIGKMRVNVDELGVDLLSLSAHKCYGPKGVGALYVRGGPGAVPLEPLTEGGGHEHGLRSGTLNVPAIVGMGEACRIMSEELPDVIRKITELTERLRTRLVTTLPEISINGSLEKRIPGNLNLVLPTFEASQLLAKVSGQLSLSATSACTSRAGRSHVLQALGIPEKDQRFSLRIGIGRFNTAEEIDFTADLLSSMVRKGMLAQ